MNRLWPIVLLPTILRLTVSASAGWVVEGVRESPAAPEYEAPVDLANLTEEQAAANGWTWGGTTNLTITGYDHGKGGVHVVIPDTIGGKPVTGFGTVFNGSSVPYNPNTWLKSVVVGKNVTGLDKFAFWYCTAMTHAVVPGNVKTITDSSFRNCSSLVSVKLGDGIETIGHSAFWLSPNLADLVLPESVTSIHNRAFSSTAITEMILPDGVTSLGQLTFNSCGQLTRVVARNVTSVGNYAFENCSGLTRVEWGETVPYLSSHNPYFGAPNVTNYYPAGAVGWLALDPQTLSGRPAAMMDSHATTLSSVAAGRKTLDDLFLMGNVQTQAATPETDHAKVYSAPAVEQAMSMRADWEPQWLGAVNGTVTVSRAAGNLQAYSATGNVVVAIEPGDSNVVSSINFFLETGGHSHTWLTNGVEYAGAFPSDGAVNVVFYSPMFSREWTATVVE